jgi:hypothetical protein
MGFLSNGEYINLTKLASFQIFPIIYSPIHPTIQLLTAINEHLPTKQNHMSRIRILPEACIHSTFSVLLLLSIQRSCNVLSFQ